MREIVEPHAIDYATRPARARRRTLSAFAALASAVLLLLAGAQIARSLKRPIEYTNVNKTKSQVSAMSSLALAIELFRQDTGALPKSLDDLMSVPTNQKRLGAWRGPYLSDPQAELHDAWGSALRYGAGHAATHNPGRYDLWSVGPDRIDRTKDDIGNW